MTTIRGWLAENKDKYEKGTLFDLCAEELKVTRKAVSNMYHEMANSPSLEKLVKKPSADDVMDPNFFISKIDIVQQILDYLDESVKDGYIEDSKLRRRFELGQTKWNQIKRLPVLEGRLFIYSTHNGQKATVWSSKKGILVARETISMARYEL